MENRLTVNYEGKPCYDIVFTDSFSDLSKEISSLGFEKMNKTEQAAKVGEKIAEIALAAGITKVVFDRNGYLYHGRVQELANGARKGGLKF